MDAIATEAEVTKPIVYRIVGDKEAVAAAIAEHLSLLIEDSNSAILDAPEPPQGRLRHAIYAFLDIVRSERALFLFVEYGWGSTDGRQIATMIDRSAKPLIEQFLQGKKADQFPDSAALTWAHATTGALRTAGLMWARNEYCDIDELADQLTYFIKRSAPEGTHL